MMQTLIAVARREEWRSVVFIRQKKIPAGFQL